MSDETITTPEIEVPQIPAAPVDPAVPEGAGDDNDEQNPEGAPATPAGEQPGTEQPPRKGGFQRKLDKEVAKRTTAEREAEFWRKEALRSRTAEEAAGKTEQKVEATAGTPNPKPKLEDFADWPPYLEALQEWTLKEADRIADAKVSAIEKRRTEEKQKQEQETETQRQQKEFDAREERASKKYHDWEEVAGTNDEPTVLIELHALHAKKQPGVPAIADVLGKADPDGDLEYYFASNPAEIARIAALEPVKASLELGKLLGTKLAPPSSATATVVATSKATPPPKVLSKSSPTSTGVDGDLAKKNFDEYYTRRQAERQKKRR